MTEIQWSAFANQYAITTIWTLVFAGLISCIGQYKWWPVGVYAFVIAVIMLFIEYPRSSKKSGRVVERKFQRYLAQLYNKCGFLYKNYFPRFILYLAFSAPCFMTLSTLIPAFNLFITACLYLFSNYKKEKWMMATDDNENTNRGLNQPPQVPPPRSPYDQKFNRV